MPHNLSTTLRRIVAAFALTVLTLTGTLVSTTSASAASVSGKSYVEGTDEQASLFDPVVVNRADITLPQTSYNNLQANGKGDYQPAQMVFTTKNGPSEKLDVGLRLKGGLGSLRNLDGKAAFKVKMNFAVKGQRLYGIKKFTFNNMVQDPSMLHEAVTYRLFRAMGVPAPRVGYVRVFVNGIDYGLHANIETYDTSSLKRWYTSTQHLYEGSYWVQDIIDSQFQSLQVDEGDLNNRDDLAALSSTNNLTGAEWFSKVQEYLDLNEFVTEMAVERYTGHWDGYAWTIKNNYYAHSTNNGLFTILPWGTDQTLNGWVDLYSYGDVGMMAQRCLSYSPCVELYKGALLKVNDVAISLKLPAMVDDVAAAINPDIISDPRKESGYDWTLWLQANTRNVLDWIAGSLVPQVNSSNASGTPNLEHSSYVRLSYVVPDDVAVGQELSPVVIRDGGEGSLTYRVVQGIDKCSVNEASGLVTVLAVGYCRVTVNVASDGAWATSLNHAELMDARKDGQVVIEPIDSAKYGTLTEVTFTSKSTSKASVKAAGPCRIVNKTFISPSSGTGTCTVTVTAPGDARHVQATAEQDVALARGEAPAKRLSNDKAFLGDLPSGGLLLLNQTPSKVTGNCSLRGNRLYAGAATGKCLVKIDSSQDDNFNYPAKTFAVQMVSGAQAFVGTFGTSGTRKIGSTKFVLARQGTQVTTLKASATWTASAGCSLIQEPTKVLVKLKGRSSCQVTLRSAPVFGLSTLVKVWNLTY